MLRLGNFDAVRDWGHAAEYVQFMAKITRLGVNDDLVVGTGKSHTVHEFLDECLRFYGLSSEVVGFDPAQVRPSEVWSLQADATVAMKKYGWEPKTTMQQIALEMCEHDLKEAERE
jgi:GDPmannose 4,6-dehydratase